jgi:hypothetical protein
MGVKGERNWEGAGSGRGTMCGWAAAVTGPVVTGTEAISGMEQGEHVRRGGVWLARSWAGTREEKIRLGPRRIVSFHNYSNNFKPT